MRCWSVFSTSTTSGSPEARSRMPITVFTEPTRLTHSDLHLARARPRSQRGELEFEAKVAPGITVTWDPATPGQCVAVSVATGSDETRSAAKPRHPGVNERRLWL